MLGKMKEHKDQGTMKASMVESNRFDAEVRDDDLETYELESEYEMAYDYDDFVIHGGSVGGRWIPSGSKGKKKFRHGEKKSAGGKNCNSVYTSKHIRAKDSLRSTLLHKGGRKSRS